MKLNLIVYAITLLQLQLFCCHSDETLCGSFLEIYSDCVNLNATIFKVNSTMEIETKFMCGIVNSIKNCDENSTFIGLVSNNVVNCSCLINNFDQTTSEYRFYKSLSNICTNTDLFPELTNWLSSSNMIFPKNTTYDYSHESDNAIKFDLYCKNYAWYDWHTSLIHKSFCIGSPGNTSILNCWYTYGVSLRLNHTSEDRRAIAANLIKCYLQDAANSCSIEMKKITTVFAIMDTEIVSKDYEMKLKVNEFFIEPINFKLCQRSSVGMLGDPHILPFSLKYQGPCNYSGNMVCLKNKYFQIDCTSLNINGMMVLAAVKIQFFYNGSLLTEYAAENSSLPGNFSNGQTLVTTKNNESSVFLVAQSSNILIVDLQTKSYIQLGVYQSSYSLLVRASDDVLRSSFGLLLSNCLTSFNGSKVVDNSTCSQLLNDTHFKGDILANWKSTFIDICNYDVKKYQNQSMHKIIHQYLHFILNSVNSDEIIINDPFKLYFKSTPAPSITTITASLTSKTVNEAIRMNCLICFMQFLGIFISFFSLQSL